MSDDKQVAKQRLLNPTFLEINEVPVINDNKASC